MLIKPATTPSCTLCQTAGMCVPRQGKRATSPRLAALERKLSGETLFKAVESYNVPEPHGQCCPALPPAPVYHALGRVRVCEVGRGVSEEGVCFVNQSEQVSAKSGLGGLSPQSHNWTTVGCCAGPYIFNVQLLFLKSSIFNTIRFIHVTFPVHIWN